MKWVEDVRRRMMKIIRNKLKEEIASKENKKLKKKN